MKNLLLLLLLSIYGYSLFSQDTIRSLVITEARLSGSNTGYIEFTNMGDSVIQLNEFEIGALSPWQSELPFTAIPGNFSRIPNKLLEPGECFVICCKHDYNPKQFALGFIEGFQERMNKTDLLDIADWIIHMPEGGVLNDSVSLKHWQWLNFDNRICYYLEQHLPNGDSVVIDQVNGVFDGANGLNKESYGYAVAGYMNGSAIGTLVRKYNIKQGNIDFANARGIGEDDSEWIVVPNQGGAYRDLFWTAGNHVNATMNNNTLESNVVDIDFTNKTITVPWGTRRADDIIKYLKKKPGIAWNYHLNSNSEDSLSFAAKTGDKLEIFACGNKVEKAVFTIIVSEPPANANLVIPVSNKNPLGYWRYDNENAFIRWPRVSRNETGIDTIWGYEGGIPYATRTDSLLERLEKAPLANWEFEWVDGIERPDLINGDILKVTASDGTIKRYYISVFRKLPKHNAYLSSITFPDISTEQSQLYGWKGDTIPFFNSIIFHYQLKVPHNMNTIPALLAKTQDINATIQVNHARNLTGTAEDRTITFFVKAEDDTTTLKYTVELIKEKSPENIQPHFAEPFLSELVFWDQWSNSFGEICNPGTVPIDLSNYMFAMAWNTNPADVIKYRMGENEWLDRYDKYVPGYKWVNEEKWKISPGILERDLSVNSIVQPGEVFCFGSIYTDGAAAYAKYNLNPSYQWQLANELDVQFNNYEGWLDSYTNPWNEAVSIHGNPVRKWCNSNWYMFKILNDSITKGLKPANDPNDFELIETFGMSETVEWKIAGYRTWNDWMLSSFIRKPHITEGNPVLEGSFGTNKDDCEWLITNDFYWEARGLNFPFSMLASGNNIGQHFFEPLTNFMSTISSEFYKVSEGYSHNEIIRGVKVGTSVEVFISNVIKADTGQTLTLKSFSGNNVLHSEDFLHMNDTLIVFSADSTNTTKYILDVTKDGLSDNSYLTSNKFIISVISEPKNDKEDFGTGIITGFEYGTTLATILANITNPYGAVLSAINGDGSFVPTKMLNFNKNYANVVVNNDILIRVIAENGITEMHYQLVPDGTENDAFLLSNIYSISQKDLLIKFVPRGTNVFSFLKNLIPSGEASLKVVNKLGQERIDGKIYDDDKVVVTSANGKVSKVYYISMLAEKYIPKTTYLAYILSDVYNVDQLEYIINGTSEETSVPDFLANIIPAVGASVQLIDKEGIEKTTGNIKESDMVRVTSLDEKTVVFYSFGKITNIGNSKKQNIFLYPNPTNGYIFIEGLLPGNRIELFNSTGILLRKTSVESTIESISLKDNSPGIYLLRITNKHKTLDNFRIIKQ
jgi:hypothetical protein